MTTPQAAAPRQHSTALAAALVFVLAVLPFLGSLSGEFLNWDDRMALLENEAWRGLGPEQLTWMATSFHMGHHMPLTWLSWAVDGSLWGLDPVAFHATNLALHGLNAVLVLLLAQRLLASVAHSLSARAQLAAAAGAALLFAVHPLRAESVAWITERRDVLSCLFLLATLLAYLRYVAASSRRMRWFALALLLYVLSLASKAWGITLPAVLLVLDLLVLQRRAPARETSWGRLLTEKLAFAPFALAAAALAAAAQKHAQAMLDLGDHGLLQRLAQAAFGLCAYPLATLWPAQLGPLYALEPALDWKRPIYLACMAAVLATGVVLWRLRHRRPAAVAAILCYAILVSPVLGLAQSGVQRWADRYSYIACIPLALLAAATGASLAARAPRQSAKVALACLALLIFLGQRTRAQVRVWQDSVSVWSRVVELEPSSYIGNWMLGISLQEEGRHDEAIERFQSALAGRADDDARLAHNNPGVRYRMALSLLELERTAEAEAVLREVLAQRPDHPPALDRLRSLLLQRGDSAELEQVYARALRHNPQFRLAWLGLIDLLLQTSRTEDALTVARQGVASLPDDAPLLARLGYTQLLLERWPQAEKNLRRAIELDPSLIVARVHLASALEAQGRTDDARTAVVSALTLVPALPGALEGLRALDSR